MYVINVLHIYQENGYHYYRLSSTTTDDGIQYPSKYYRHIISLKYIQCLERTRFILCERAMDTFNRGTFERVQLLLERERHFCSFNVNLIKKKSNSILVYFSFLRRCFITFIIN